MFQSSDGCGVITGNSIIKCLLGEVAGLVWGVQDLVVEDGEVEGQAKADGMGRGQLGLSNLCGSLVSLQGLVGGVLATIADGELGEVAVIIALPAGALAQQRTRYREGLTYILW